MQVVETLMHSDEVSVTFVMNDGTKCHYSEGSSDFVIVRPSGEKIVAELAYIPDRDLAGCLDSAMSWGVFPGTLRSMVDAEEEEEYYEATL